MRQLVLKHKLQMSIFKICLTICGASVIGQSVCCQDYINIILSYSSKTFTKSSYDNSYFIIFYTVAKRFSTFYEASFTELYFNGNNYDHIFYCPKL